MTYTQCLDAMYALRRFGIKLDLDTIGGILAALGNPHKQLRFIHIAGTNGKGSIAAFLAEILKRGGYRVGLFTSPHLVRFNERIQINGHPIEDDHLVEAYTSVNRAVRGKRDATFFEITTAMALYEFARAQVDLAVSNISIEHRQYLGNTLAAIATEKAGIIKTGVPVVTGVHQPNAVTVIEKIAAGKSAPCYRLGKAFRIRRGANHRFNYYGLHHTWRDLVTGLAGDQQLGNAALAMAACELLVPHRISVTEAHIRGGLKDVQWPGRLQVISTDPYILLDGAHNLAAAGKLARFLSANLPDRRIFLIIGILDGKPYGAMLKALAPLAEHLIVTRASSDRALPPETLAQAAAPYARDIVVQPDTVTALRYALAAMESHDAIVVAGSLYVVGEAMAYWHNNPPPDPGESA